MESVERRNIVRAEEVPESHTWSGVGTVWQ